MYEPLIDYLLMALFFWYIASYEYKNRWWHCVVVGIFWPLIYLCLAISPWFERKEQ